MARVQCNGVTLSVTEFEPRPKAAADPPVIFIHGLAASSAFWFAAGAQFTTVIGRAIIYDLRGHGKSETPDSGYSTATMVDDLIALMDAKGVQKAHLVAHSFGGMIAVLAALKHPERVASLSLVDTRLRPLQTSLQMRKVEVSPAVATRLEHFGIDIEAIKSADDGISYLNSIAHIQEAAGDEANDLLNALYRHPRLFKSGRNARRWIHLTEKATLVSDIKNEQAFDTEDLRNLALPILILVGGNSPILPSAQALARLCPQAIMRVVPDVGHFFPVAHPRLFLRPTLRFLQRIKRETKRFG